MWPKAALWLAAFDFYPGGAVNPVLNAGHFYWQRIGIAFALVFWRDWMILDATGVRKGLWVNGWALDLCALFVLSVCVVCVALPVCGWLRRHKPSDRLSDGKTVTQTERASLGLGVDCVDDADDSKTVTWCIIQYIFLEPCGVWGTGRQEYSRGPSVCRSVTASAASLWPREVRSKVTRCYIILLWRKSVIVTPLTFKIGKVLWSHIISHRQCWLFRLQQLCK